MNQVNVEKGDSIIQKCQRLFINYIKGASNLDECINESEKNIKNARLNAKHWLTLVKSVLLNEINIVKMIFTYKNTVQYDISCKNCKHAYHDPDN